MRTGAIEATLSGGTAAGLETDIHGLAHKTISKAGSTNLGLQLRKLHEREPWTVVSLPE